MMKIDCRWLPLRNPERNPTGRRKTWSREGCSLLLEDFPGSFWFLALVRYFVFLCNPLIK